MSGLPNDIANVITDYLPVLNRMSAEKCNTLVSGILRMRKYGVDAYSERIIYKNGYSSMFCTSLHWAKINKDREFYNDFRNHVSPEIVKSFQNNTRLISRSGDRTESAFLKSLEDAGVNNSIILEEFHANYIKITYFMGAPRNPGARDNILSNMACLSFIQTSIAPALKEIFESREFKEKKEYILNPQAVEAIWGNTFNKDRGKITFLTDYPDLTYREAECLAYLRFGSSNEVISKNLKISNETVKFHIANLKEKLLVSSRKDLISLAQEPSIKNISKIIGEL